jgi:phospholipase C
MTSESRRDFLKTAGSVAGAAAAMTAFPPVIRQALAIPANNATRSIKDVEHIVVLMQENRSFDSYFGTMAGVRGFGDRFTIPLPGGASVFQQSNGNRVVMPYHLDEKRGNAQRVKGTPHTWSDTQAAWASGLMTNWPEFKQNQSMGYYRAEELPFQFALANAFTLCDNYHCSLLGGTIPNRLFLWTGTNGPSGQGVAMVVNEWDTCGPSTEGFTYTTYPERLQQAGISWKVYQNMPENYDDNMLISFRQYRAASEAIGNRPDGSPFTPWDPSHDKTQPLYKGAGNTMPAGGLLEEFRADVMAGRLPQISWIVQPEIYSEHPGPSSPVQGGWYTQEVLAALVANPEVWSKTVLIVNFDENDGFFDHAPPPALHSLNPDGSHAGASTVSDQDLAFERFTWPVPPGTKKQPGPDGNVFGPGNRVPCYVVSPWSRGGWVNSQLFDHTSVLQFMELRFGVREPNISAYRRAICGDLTTAFNFKDPNTERLPSLPSITRAQADARRTQQEALPQVPLPDPSAQSAPVQARGTKPSRALPYELNVNGDADGPAKRMRLQFLNTGDAGAVFHVYDKLHLDRIPRRYSVEAGKQLTGEWDTAADLGAYDLWVLGPNGFHRHFIGTVIPGDPNPGPEPEVTVAYDTQASSLAVTLVNNGDSPCAFTVWANAYKLSGLDMPAPQPVPAHTQSTIHLPLDRQGRWYDFSVTVEGDDLFSRRFAGRMEDGTPSVSDPAMGELNIA